MSEEEDVSARNLVGYRSGAWEIVRAIHDENADSRPMWGDDGVDRRTRYALCHRFGPVLDGCVYIDGVTGDQFNYLNEMEVLAIAAMA